MIQPDQITQAIVKAVNKAIEDIIEEEVKMAQERIRTRIVAKTTDISAIVMQRISWDMGRGEIQIRLTLQ